ncbi:TetM/TetW/TetO/TetS family tetracycline resistance ribosomal protection protein [Microbispora corallina]|uniref:Tetracycline resistance protein, tetM/tetO subfamily n=1 Tax=Microbispora corallina TaxID=83302 RepID=A0ABQ4G9P1_9ACTN|nr:TetM/TetW/TetO/TetS family tetracycline resistance ribosomal protection protein [Microbispora corallina]GIH43747.1 tetracycline resistance protein, tetM/tetO subfamily [Microbispora corallina]
MKYLNLGILAHVDAGKTSLTERLLYAAGVIGEIGSVDEGSTQTDTLALERRRGITIKSAVVSFDVGDVVVNLIDTPGHPDFIAEVERVLGVLDGAVLVVSAVEAVQAQTRVLMRALRRLRIPTLVFVNKVDRRGADVDRVVAAVREHLTPSVVAMGAVRGLGTPRAACAPYGEDDEGFAAALADLLARHDDGILAAYVEGGALPYGVLREALAAQTARALTHPLYAGSAITGAGVDALVDGLTELLPAYGGDADGPVSGTVFKVERGPAGEKIAYVRLFSGTVRARDRLRVGGDEWKVTALQVFDNGSAVERSALPAGRIGRLWGLAGVRIGDPVGVPRDGGPAHRFSPPSLETAVVPRRPEDKAALHLALTRLAEQDPLIDLRQDDVRQEMFLSLYGEVQKEVIQETLLADFGVEAEFRETSTICVERPAGTGEAAETLGEPDNPFMATLGLRVEPAPPGSGVRLGLDVKIGAIPLYVYKTVEAFQEALGEVVRETLRQGLHGWEVVDCAVTVTRCGYVSPLTTARDVRLLAPLVLMSALRRAGTTVCGPVHRFRLEAPADAAGPIGAVLARLGAVPGTPETRGRTYALDGHIPAGGVHELRLRLGSLTSGEGVLEAAFDHYEPVRGEPPARPRTDRNPLNRAEYLLHLSGRA